MAYNYRRNMMKRNLHKNTKDFFEVFSDREIKLILIWALIGPFTALAYVVWVKYPNLRWLSVIFFILNFIYLGGGLGGWLYLLPKLFNYPI